MKNNLLTITCAFIAVIAGGCANPHEAQHSSPQASEHKPVDPLEHVRRIVKRKPQLLRHSGAYLIRDGRELWLYGFGHHHTAKDDSPKAREDAWNISNLRAQSELSRFRDGVEQRADREFLFKYSEENGKSIFHHEFRERLLQKWGGILHGVETIDQRKNGSKFSTILRISLQPNQKKDQP